ncbi:MAG: dihydrodipicolinate synthase family protein [Verrucomicrobiota bacterium]
MNLHGLISATYTPFQLVSGELNLALIEPMTDFMLSRGTDGLYVCGSTGEGESLSLRERKEVAEAFVSAANRRVPVVIQVGHNSLASAKELAVHAREIGADAISSLPPSYFKPNTPEALIACIAELANAVPELPYYYYHIPTMSGVRVDLLELLSLASKRIPSFRGVKFSDPDLSEMMACQAFDGGRYDIPFGSDQMLLGALACGATAAVGSSYGFAGPQWQRIIATHEAGHGEEALRNMQRAAHLVRLISTAPGPFHACVKQVIWPLHGFEPGPLRLPQATLTSAEIATVQKWLIETGFGEELVRGEFPAG